MLNRKYVKAQLVFLILSAWCGTAHAVCGGSIINPITDVNWQCIFPIKIAGVTAWNYGGLPDTPDLSNSPVCVCPAPPPAFVRTGLPLAFWEPSLMIETVKDPFCFPVLGMGFSASSFGIEDGNLAGTSNDNGHQFAQSHYFAFPVWSIIGAFADSACVEAGTFNLTYLTEIDPLWQDDIMSMVISPEAVLVASYEAVVSCMADATATAFDLALSPLFWCMGSWGNAYPLTGHITNGEVVEANAGIAGRMLYKQARQLNLFDCNIDPCACLPSPIWIKQNYRMHVVKPYKSFDCMTIGRTGLTWSYSKNPPTMKGDNFLWLIFKKRFCCAI